MGQNSTETGLSFERFAGTLARALQTKTTRRPLVLGASAGTVLVSPLGRAISALANSPEGGAEDPVRLELEAKGLKVESWNALTTGPDGQQKSVTLRIAYKECRPDQDLGVVVNLDNLDTPQTVIEHDPADPQKGISRVAVPRTELEKLMLASGFQNIVFMEDEDPEMPRAGVAYVNTPAEFRNDRTIFTNTTYLAQPNGFPNSLVAKTWFNKSGRLISAEKVNVMNNGGISQDFAQAAQDYPQTSPGEVIPYRGSSSDITKYNVEGVFHKLNPFQVIVPPTLIQQPASITV